jgi:tetratricopeptide (TPR) repeat protein
MLAEARADAFSRAILGWARADLALDEGRADAAVAAFDRAAAELARAGLPELRADLLRRAAERLCVRGEALPAEDAWRRARAAYRKADLRTGVAACLRGSADLAVSTGAWISAGALQEEIEDAPADGLEMENRRLGAASQCLARGELARAEAMLAVSIAGAEDDALWRANVLRRRADVLLRRGQHASAMLAADEAAKRYAEANEGVAQAAALRLGADVAAAAGRLSEARARYREATLLHVRVGDLRGLCRTLGNAAGVEESIGNVEGVRRLRQQRAAVMQLSTE